LFFASTYDTFVDLQVSVEATQNWKKASNTGPSDRHMFPLRHFSCIFMSLDLSYAVVDNFQLAPLNLQGKWF
jgi:hypothetical protein